MADSGQLKLVEFSFGFCHGKNYYVGTVEKPVKTVAKTGKIKDTIN